MSQGPSFKATGLHNQAGNDGLASPPHSSAAEHAEAEEEDMLDLPAGSHPSRIPVR